MTTNRAIILAAGEGKRLLNNSCPKCLLKINNETILTRLLNQLFSFGINDITIVVGYEKEKILKEISVFGNKIKTVDNRRYKEDTNILSLKITMDDHLSPCYIIEADCVFRNECFEMLTQDEYEDKSIWCSIGSFQGHKSGGILKESDGKVTDIKIVKKYDESLKDYRKMIGMLKIGKKEIDLYYKYLVEYCDSSIKQYYHNPWIDNISRLESYLCDFPVGYAYSFNTPEEYVIVTKAFENEIN